jgi:hypothetical protein
MIYVPKFSKAFRSHRCLKVFGGSSWVELTSVATEGRLVGTLPGTSTVVVMEVDKTFDLTLTLLLSESPDKRKQEGNYTENVQNNQEHSE